MAPPRSHAFLSLGLFAIVQVAACNSAPAPPIVPLAVMTGSLPNGTVGIPYSVTLAATGGYPPYTWSLTPHFLPPGLTFDGNIISGTPTTAGNFGPYSLGVTDSQSDFASSQNFDITIRAASSSSSCAPRGSEAELSSASPYAFLVKGTDSAGNPIDIAGSFTPDGNGGIANAAVDYNGITNGPEQMLVNLSASSYGFDSSGEGCLHSRVRRSGNNVNERKCD